MSDIQMVQGYKPPPQDGAMDYAGVGGFSGLGRTSVTRAAYQNVGGNTSLASKVAALNGLETKIPALNGAGCGCGNPALRGFGAEPDRPANIATGLILTFAAGHLLGIWAELGLYGKRARSRARRGRR